MQLPKILTLSPIIQFEMRMGYNFVAVQLYEYVVQLTRLEFDI